MTAPWSESTGGAATSGAAAVARRLCLAGQVQGLGVRPALARLARRHGLVGWAANARAGVELVVAGASADVDAFLAEWPQALPPGAWVDAAEVSEAPLPDTREFVITTSEQPGPTRVVAPLDRAVCPECLAETLADTGRRAGYPFTSCTSCGPRYTILERLPHQRAATAMHAFAICPACAAEFHAPGDRRYHAEEICCPRCGPAVWLSDAAGRIEAWRADAVHAAAQALREGRIVALRGLGGYQLLCDATSGAAVERLRDRKGRRARPLAVMVASLAEARRIAELGALEEQALTGPAGPIVIARAAAGSGLASGISPGLQTVGVMLPTTPLHALVARGVGRPLVCTSGNREGEPLETDADSALRALGSTADLFLHHDRAIVRPLDDGVVLPMAGRLATIRLGRGLGPRSLDLGRLVDDPLDEPPSESDLAAGALSGALVALGGHQKGALALVAGGRGVLGPHVGDLDTVATRARYLEQLHNLAQLYGVEPVAFAHDLHPDYFTTAWFLHAGRPLVGVQHHHAHVAAAMLDQGWLDGPVLGLACDGTGYGPDGTIWGGELLRATLTSYERQASLRPFVLPGGERAVREPWRVALALVAEATSLDVARELRFPPPAAGVFAVPVEAAEVRRLAALTQRPRLFPVTTSMGRLFDGIAALALGATASPLEGHPAMLLEAACDPSADGAYPLPLTERAGHGPGAPMQLDWRPLVRDVLEDVAAGVPGGVIAIRFHRGVAAGLATWCDASPELPVVLAGGVFQNRVLTELVADRLLTRGRRVGLPGAIPVNDGGLAAGQLAVALARSNAATRRREASSCA